MDRGNRSRGKDLVDRIKEVVKAGNVRKVILRNPDGKLLLEIPLTAGAVAGGVVGTGCARSGGAGRDGALLAKVKVEIVRTDKPAD